MTFGEFYTAYLAEHQHPANRALHLLAKVAMLAALGLAAIGSSLAALLLAPVLGVLPCWLGHFVFEHNRPTAWSRPAASLLGSLTRAGARSGEGRPWYSFVADLRMCRDTLRGEARLDE